MGNRFLAMAGYQSLIKAHGIMASITFLLLVPLAILLMRFYGRNPRNAVRFHIWLQITALLLTIVVFATGFFAVGARRSLTNPHHGIGVALFVLVWVQVIGGALVHRKERGGRRYHVPLKAMLHHWLGRAIALLGIAQVALGLTLYGSPLYLFVLYTLWVFLLLVVYFILQWRHERRRARVAPGDSEYSSELTSEQRPQQSHSGFGKIATAGAAGAGLAALWNRRNKPKRRHSESDLTYTSRSSSSDYYRENEKQHGSGNRTGWGKRILQVGAIGGGIAAAKKLFDRRKAGRDDESDIGPYRPPLGGNTSIGSDSVSRLEEGPARPATPTGPAASGARPVHPLAQPPMTPGPGSGRPSEEYSYYSYESSSPSRQGRHQTFRQAAAAGGTMYAVKQLFKKRGQKREEDRTEELRQQRVEQENIARMNSQHRYTGDGTAPPRRPRHNRATSQTASDVSSVITGSVQRPGMSGMSGMSTAPPVAGGPGAAASAALADRNRIRPVGTDPPIAYGAPAPAAPMAGPDLPPPVPAHGTELSSGSELYTTNSGRQRHRHHLAGPEPPPMRPQPPPAAPPPMGRPPPGPASPTADRRRRQPQHEAANTDSLESPPVSIHVQTQDNGRKVTLRRLTEEEAAAQRAARRSDRRTSRRRRNSSLGSSSGGDFAGAGGSGAPDRWKTTEQREAEQQAAMDEGGSTPRPSTANLNPPPNRNNAYPASGAMYPTPPPPGTHQTIDPHTGFSYAVPPPPPIPASTNASNVGPGESVTSPGTETSGPSEYANNRRRRRAERAQARLAREGRLGGAAGNTVDFT